MKDDRVYLAHILECIERVERYTADGEDVFFRDSLIQDGVIKNLMVMGEAANKISKIFQGKHPEIAWKGMTGLRNVLIHGYDGLDLGQVWQVVKRELSGVKSTIAHLVPPLDQLEAELAGEDDTDKE